MTSRRLASIQYEPPGRPSLFHRWEAGHQTDLVAPLAVRDPQYRASVLRILEPFRDGGSRLVSVGAGNGFIEADLAAAGWDVLATDPADAALALCRAKGLATASFDLLGDSPSIGTFDVIYCDGVMGHLWEPSCGSSAAWSALAALGAEGSICLVSNDLSDGDAVAQFAVRSSTAAFFYRPPPGTYARDALVAARWSIESTSTYHHARAGVARRREAVVARLLMYEGIEAEDGS